MADGRTIAWSPRKRSKEYAEFQLPCGQCIQCRLDYARQWAVRCVHESKMHEKNCFVTLTYDDEHLKSPKLIYRDFQLFAKSLRKLQNDPIGYFVTGEYGDKTKRPHWHVLIFNWAPADGMHKYTSELGDRVCESKTLGRLWKHGLSEYGSVTFKSAAYCARYAAKKLVHGSDGHEYEPISKKSNKHAIGKAWLEKHYEDVVREGRIILDDGTAVPVPRYYEKWLKENKPDLWLPYVTKVKANLAEQAREKQKKINDQYWAQLYARAPWRANPLTPNQVRARIIESRFNVLQQHLKL